MNTDNNLLKALGLTESDIFHRALGSTFIVEFGIIKDIPADGIVTVEMSAANTKEDIIITNCILASIATASIAVNIVPQINDKVIVLFPRKFAGRMFQASVNESIVTESCDGYVLTGGIAFLVNQIQPSFHKNNVTVNENGVSINLAYSEDDSKNLFTVQINPDGTCVLNSNKSTIDINKSGMTIQDENGNKIETSSSSLKINGKLEITT